MDVTLRPGQILTGRDIYLEPPPFKDMDFVRWLWNDAETMLPVGGPITMTDEQAVAWYARMVHPGRRTDCYCLIRLADATPVGEVSFHRLDVRTMTADLNIKVMAAARRGGIARDALRTFLGYFFDVLGGDTIYDTLAHGNLAGQRTLANFGFRQLSIEPDGIRFRLSRAAFHRTLGAGEG